MTKVTEELGFKYVLCAIESRVWTGAVTDTVTSNEVTASKKAAADAGKFVKVLVKSSALAKVRNSLNKARMALYSNSVPWLASSHLVKIDRMEYVNGLIEEQRAEFEAAVAQFIDEYPRLLEGAQERLGALFDPTDYPKAEHLPGKFSFSATWLPFTHVSPDMLAMFDTEAAEMIEGSVANAIQRAKREAHAEMIDRAVDSVEGVKEALERYSKASDAGERAVLHESRIESLSTTAADLRDYTFAEGSYRIGAIGDAVTALQEAAREGVDTYKESAPARAKAVSDLEQIKARLESMRNWG
jgi:hypothetical protein